MSVTPTVRDGLPDVLDHIAMPAFDGLLIVVAVAFAAPLVLGLFPSVKLPSVVLEILAGIVIGPRCWESWSSTSRSR